MERKYNQGVADSNRRRTKHGATSRRKGQTVTDRMYRTWSDIKQRCINPKDTRYHRYGGRGIIVHESWLTDFAQFVSDVGQPPETHMTLDRIDNNRGYEPGNVRWATRKEQANNRENNIRVTYKGETLSLSQWADKLGIGYTVLAGRWKTGKRDPEKLLRPDGTKYKSVVEYKGQFKTLAKWAEESGVSYYTLYWRHKNNKPLF